ncbi:recombination and repair protein RecT [Poriferisphaera corsica]|uniref:Recombination and repair protein RecT n=1 Tax=Poriferisphaera corsica TaxID=2528020 RepID=A0A517YVQ3_9BACT|nr:recombinase RecT [Poriferisphaera corsica]QDU34315.1 recombination and repair protein RecT [Poriferisphaera corsica]
MSNLPATAEGNNDVVKFSIHAPVQTHATLKDFLGQSVDRLADVAPKHFTPERLVKMVLLAANHQPKILKCTALSILEATMTAAELGLDCSGTKGEAYLVPFNCRVGSDYQLQAKLLPGYKGLAKLARQSGEIKTY